MELARSVVNPVETSPPHSEATLPASPPASRLPPPPQMSPKIPLTGTNLFSGAGAPAASATVTGHSAELLIEVTKRNIAHHSVALKARCAQRLRLIRDKRMHYSAFMNQRPSGRGVISASVRHGCRMPGAISAAISRPIITVGVARRIQEDQPLRNRAARALGIPVPIVWDSSPRDRP